MSDVDEHSDDVVPTASGQEPVEAGIDGDDAIGRPPSRRPFDWKLWIACLPIAVGVALIGFGLATSITGDDVTQLPDEIESISPVPDAVQVLAQTNVVVDLAEGYEGALTVDGIEFRTLRLEDYSNPNVEPGTQVDIPAGVLFEPGNETLTFTPGPDIEITRFAEGNHTVRVEYWRSADPERRARSYTWTFNVV
jgi:hypothetical protein